MNNDTPQPKGSTAVPFSKQPFNTTPSYGCKLNSAIDATQPTVKESLTVQKPRCPVPVHLWKKEWKGVFIGIDGAVRAEIITTYKFSYPSLPFDAKGLPAGTTWTRAEALASQMLPAPDRAGVWLIDCGSVSGAPPQSDVFESVEIHKGYEMKGYVRSVYELCWSVEMGARFYFMGPLPEGEVSSE